ncbi:MAG TPA: GtrA family protein [Streptosporangiaceae bacterium]|nr:GtrA family protein [Streptosporangiaceae bacterium]
MSSAHALYARFRHLIHEAFKFGVVGGIAFVVTEVGANVLHFDAGLGPLTATVIATLVATAVSYVGNRYWTFRHRESTTSNVGHESALFFVLNGVGLGIQLAPIGFTYYIVGLTDRLSYNVALILGIALGTLFRFWSYRRWVWRAPLEQALDNEHEALHPEPAGAPAPDQAGRHRRTSRALPL